MTPSTQTGLPPPARLWAMAALSIAVCLATLDTAITNTALPTIAREFAAGPADTIWIVTSYQLVMIAAMLPLASLGERFGQRAVFVAGIAVFAAASLACGLARSLQVLVGARALQGLGAAAIMSANTALVRHIYPEANLGRGLGLNALVIAFGLAAGPVLASAILAVATWHWLFLVNVPAGLLALSMALRMLPRPAGTAAGFDGVAALLCFTMFALFVHGLGEASHRGAWALVAAEWALALLCGYLLARRQRRGSSPILPVDLLRIPLFGLSSAVAVCAFATQGLALVALPFHFMADLGRGQVELGLLIAPWPLLGAAMAPVAGSLSDRYPAGLLGGAGLLCLASGIALLALLPAATSTAAIVGCMALCGFGFGLFLSPNQRSIMASAPARRSGAASGILGTARLLGQALGAAIVALWLTLSGTAGARAALWVGCLLAVAGAIASMARLLPARKHDAHGD
ncbi:MFS transporter [Stenotrophomonas sp. MMGLT7]|uniref:MFS transporter n=1 Tax=Stenotrophomonas sp. MMGLT7 TaxID=2901227 RepID=UPI001E3AC0EE|nr:MFS transporter [Stenotrophomonas sp. MMGLT7]MCD7098262.1 MFS transporter [Stenotrophomonas sp. MMGLT7]